MTGTTNSRSLGIPTPGTNSASYARSPKFFAFLTFPYCLYPHKNTFTPDPALANGSQGGLATGQLPQDVRFVMRFQSRSAAGEVVHKPRDPVRDISPAVMSNRVLYHRLLSFSGRRTKTISLESLPDESRRHTPRFQLGCNTSIASDSENPLPLPHRQDIELLICGRVYPWPDILRTYGGIHA